MSSRQTIPKEGKKRRGTASVVSDESIKIRREKNREAQQVFRKRRQAAEAAQSRRTRRLEEAVEQISCVFIGFFDEMLRNEAIARDYPSLMSSLRHSLAQVLTLAKGVVDLDDGMLTAAGVTSDKDKPPSPKGTPLTTTTKIPEHQLPTDFSPGQVTAEWVPDEVVHFCVPGNVPGAISAFYGSNISPDTGTLPGPPSLNLTNWDDSAATTSSTSLSLQVYGNGWTDSHTPPSHIEDPFRPSSLQIQRELAALDSFPLRLTQRTVELGYYTLLKDPVGGIKRPGFRLSRRYRTAEQLMTSFRWLMGPGKDYIYRASGFMWGHDGGTIATLPSHMLNDPSGALNGDQDIPECLTAIGITKHLESLKAKMVDFDTMEVQLGMPPSDDFGGAQAGDATDTRIQPWSYIDFFFVQPPTPTPTPLTLRLNVTRFVQNLSEIAICFSRGPGFPKHELFSVMKASSAMV